MGDSTTMTIEFLRARLLSERSVSRTARQRADQLAKRVVELEEQLRIVTIQRKKAEKAAVEVLAILEAQGANGFTEIVDSSSDHDEDFDLWKQNDNNLNGIESSAMSRMEKNEVEDGLSRSDVEVSPSQGRSLSWKRRSDSPNSRRMLGLKQFRQRQRRCCLLVSMESSPKHPLGKSCRKIKKREMGSAAKAEADNTVLDTDEKREATSSNHSDDQSYENQETLKDEIKKSLTGTPVALTPGVENRENGKILYVNREDRDEEMERVLEQRDQLIDQYQAEENAQREWEEKYNEKTNSFLGVSGSRNQSSTVGRGSKGDEQSLSISDKNPDGSKEANFVGGNILGTTEPAAQSSPNVSVPKDENLHGSTPEQGDSNQKFVAVGLPNGFGHADLTARNTSSDHEAILSGQQNYKLVAMDSRTSSNDFTFPTKQHLTINKSGSLDHAPLYDGSDTSSPSDSSLLPHGHGFFERQSTWSLSSDNSFVRCTKWGPSETIQPQRPQTSSNNLGGVLNALQRAKASLRQQLDGSPSPSQGILARTAPAYSQARAGNADIPNGSAGLFRLPTDSFPRNDLSKPKLHGLGFSMTSAHADFQNAINRSDHQYSVTPYVEAGPRVSVGNRNNDVHITSSATLPSSRRFSFQNSSLVADEAPAPAPIQRGFSRSYLDVRNETSVRDSYLYGGERSRFDLRRL